MHPLVMRLVLAMLVVVAASCGAQIDPADPCVAETTASSCCAASCGWTSDRGCRSATVSDCFVTGCPSGTKCEPLGCNRVADEVLYACVRQ